MNLESGDGHVMNKKIFVVVVVVVVFFHFTILNQIVNAGEAPYMSHVMYELRQ